MLKSGDVLDLGPLGAKFTVGKTGVETDGHSFEMEWVLDPHTGGTPVHIHPQAVETYEVLQGDFDVYIDGTWRTLHEGEKVAADMGIPHTFRNASDKETRVYNIHQPAMKFDQYFEGLYKLVTTGVIKSDKMTIRALLYLSILMTSYEDEIQSVRPPYAIIKVFGFIGRLLGYSV